MQGNDPAGGVDLCTEQLPDIPARRPEVVAIKNQLGSADSPTIIGEYFKTRGFEANGRIYEAMGVPLFGRALMSAAKRIMPGVEEVPTNYTVGGSSPEALRKYEKRSRFNEVVHLSAGVLALTKGREGRHPVIFAAICAVNVYCFMLQRYNRARITGVLSRQERRMARREGSMREEE